MHEINDVALVGVVHPELGIGYDLWVGGGLSTGPAPGRAARRLRRARAGRRRLARRQPDLPRLRLPAPAQQGAPEVPAGRVGPREVPRRCSRTSTSATRCPTAPPRRSPARPGDHVGVHQQKDGRFYVGAAPIVGRVSRPTCSPSSPTSSRPRGSDAAAHHPAPEARRPRRPRRPRSTSLVAGLDALGLSARPSLVPPRHDRLHRHRVLQARHRRDQGHRGHGRSPSSSAASPTSPTQLDTPIIAARQRLPQLLRPHPDRRHRPQGPDRHDRRRAGAGLPGAPRRRARVRRPRRGRPRPHRARPEGHRRRPRPTTSSASCAASLDRARRPTRPSPSGPTAPTRRSCSR